jgi:hypothetical protein
MKKELLDIVIEDAWQAVKGAIERAYYKGKQEAKEELLLEARALIKAADVKLNPGSTSDGNGNQGTAY